MKMDYKKLSEEHLSQLNKMHEFPKTFNQKSYRHHAVLANLYMTLYEKEEIQKEINFQDYYDAMEVEL